MKVPGLIALLAAALALGAWLIPKLLAASDQGPCIGDLLQRVRKVQVGTPFEDEKLLSGEAIYQEALHMTGAEGQAKVQVRTERRYSGPLLQADELQALLDRGLADSLAHLLLDPHLGEVTTRMSALERTLGQLAWSIDLEIEQAKREVQGTLDQIVVELKRPGALEKKSEVMRAVRTARPGEERYVAEIAGERETWFRLRRERFPRLFDLARTQKETLALRREFLAAQVQEVLQIHGLAALDPTKFHGRTSKAPR